MVTASSMTVVSFVIVGVAPRTIGRQHAYTVGRIAAPFVLWLGRVLGPLASLVGASFGLTMGTKIEPRQVPLFFSIVVIPITFLGATYYPWTHLTPIPWLKAVVLLNPLVYMSEGFRMALTPLSHMSGLAIYGGLIGFAVLFTVRNQDGQCPWCQVEQVVFEGNVVQHSSGGVKILGYDDGGESQQTRGITIRGNLFADIDNTRWGGTGYFLLLVGNPRDIVIDETLPPADSDPGGTPPAQDCSPAGSSALY